MVFCLEDDTDDGVAIFMGTRPRMRDRSSYTQSWRDYLFCGLSVTHSLFFIQSFAGVPVSLMLGRGGGLMVALTKTRYSHFYLRQCQEWLMLFMPILYHHNRASSMVSAQVSFVAL